jgi:hypothetical protein
MQPLFNGENSKIDFYNDPTLGALELAEKWYSVVGRIYAGESVPDIIEHQDVVELYKGIFSDITYIYEKFSYPFMYKRNTPFVEDLHPTPLEALAFLDHVWPKNKLSQTAREYARHWNYEIFKLSKMPVAPIHYVAPITRL